MRPRFLLMLALSTLVLLGGCIKQRVILNPDGSGVWAFGLALSISDLQALEEQGASTDSDLDDVTFLLENRVTDPLSGITFFAEERLENGQKWFYVMAEVPTLEAWSQIEAAANRVLPQDDSDSAEGAGQLDISEPIFPRITIEGDFMTVEMTYTPAPADPSVPEGDPFSASMDAATNALLNFSIEIAMPGELLEHNGRLDQLTFNPVWFIDEASGEPLNIRAVSRIR
jgi:hypothetical protein